VISRATARTFKRLLLVGAALTFGGTALVPVTVLAHASVVSARPAPGDELSTAPGVVDLQFSEPINQRLSRLVVTGPGGNPFPFQVVGPGEMQAQVTSTERGLYTVSWTTVSDVDGHTLRGSFRFGVGVPVAAGASAAGAADPQPQDLLVAVLRAFEYIGLFGAVGCFVVAALVRREPAIGLRAPTPRWALLVALLAGTTVVAGESISAAGGLSITGFSDYLLGGPAGYARLARIGLEAVALLVATPGAELALIPVVGAMLAIAAAGHAAADRPWPLGVATDALHLLAGAVWAGGLLAIASVSMRAPREKLALLILRFSRVALVAFGLSVALGAVRGTQELAQLGDFVSTGYGRVLGIKILVVAAVVPVALVVRRAAGRLLRLDAAIATTIVAITASLAAFPLPPRRAQEADAADRATGAAQAWPRQGDLTMAVGARHTLVGLTLRPGRPGRNQVILYLVPPPGEAAAQGIQAKISFAGSAVPLTVCGSSCRTGVVDLNGPVSAHVDLSGSGRGSIVLAIPKVPADDAAAMFQAARERMARLTSYADDEVFGPVEPPLGTKYQFEKPDRMHVRGSLGAEQVWVGSTIYRRDSPSAAWRIEPAGAPLRVGEFIWDGGTPLNVRNVGESGSGAGHLTEISFFELRDQTPLWFRVWVDDNQMVARSEMRAQSHFMDDSYSQFDVAFKIVPPV
jgi:copper transport protein